MKTFQMVQAHKSVLNRIVQMGGVEGGTPAYVYFPELLLKNYDELCAQLPAQTTISFAAFTIGSNAALTWMLCQRGAGVMVTSIPSLRMVEKAGFPPERISYVASGVARKDLELLVKAGVFVYLDSVGQIRSFREVAGEGASCGLRVRLDIRPAAGWATAIGDESRIGIAEPEMEAALREASSLGLKVKALHIYVGSNLLNYGDMLAVFRHYTRLVARCSALLPHLETVNAGGGFGFEPGAPSFDMRAYAAGVEQEMTVLSRKYGRKLGLTVEPGRKLFADTGVFLTTVTDVREYRRDLTRRFINLLKSVRNPDYRTRLSELWRVVSCDSSCAMAPRTWLYGTEKPVTVLGKENEPSWGEVTLGGHSTFSMDMLTKNVPCPRVAPGDVIVIHGMGAYEDAMRSNHLQQLMPPVILIMQDGTSLLVRGRRTIEQVLGEWNWGVLPELDQMKPQLLSAPGTQRAA